MIARLSGISFRRSISGGVQACEGDWIVYYEPVKVPGTRGYFAVAKVQQIIPDPGVPGMYLAIIEEGSYLDFASPVPFSGPEGLIERGLYNALGAISGRAQSAVRTLSASDFNRIVELGLADNADLPPSIGETALESVVQEERSPFLHEQERERVLSLTSRPLRDRVFRRVVLKAYDERCAITGLKLINGGGRAEAEAAHIRPVERNGPDTIQNGLALSGTVHWLFDRGLISLSDNLDIMVSRQVNDRAGVEALVNRSGKALQPVRETDRPHPHFLAWHREHCFKQ